MMVAVLVPMGPSAEELRVGLSGGVAWTDNVFGVDDDARLGGESEDPEQDFSFRTSARLDAQDSDGAVHWRIGYQPSWERFFDNDELTGFGHNLNASATWRPTPGWQISLNQRYALYQNAIRFNEVAAPGEEATFGFRDQEVRNGRTGLSLRRQLDARAFVQLQLSYQTFEYPDGNTADRGTPSTEARFLYDFTRRTRLGGVARWSQQRFERQSGTDTTDFYNLSATLEHQFTPTLRLVGSAGPTFIDSSPVAPFRPPQFATAQFLGARFALNSDQCSFQDVPGRVGINGFQGCVGQFTRLTGQEVALVNQPVDVPVVDGNGAPVDLSDTGGTDLTYFANLSLTKSWETVNGALTYQRSNSDRARFGSSTVADILSGTLSWTPTRRWRLSTSLAAALQEQSVDQPIPVALDTVNAAAPPGVTSVTELAEVTRVVVTQRSGAEEYRTLSAYVSAHRSLTRRASVFVSAQWFHQQQDGGLSGFDKTWNTFTAWVGLDWNFDPISF